MDNEKICRAIRQHQSISNDALAEKAFIGSNSKNNDASYEKLKNEHRLIQKRAQILENGLHKWITQDKWLLRWNQFEFII